MPHHPNDYLQQSEGRLWSSDDDDEDDVDDEADEYFSDCNE